MDDSEDAEIYCHMPIFKHAESKASPVKIANMLMGLATWGGTPAWACPGLAQQALAQAGASTLATWISPERSSGKSSLSRLTQ